eukprot:scaffold17166_cov113-Cylindrotheca_fusiformis.AAC.3
MEERNKRKWWEVEEADPEFFVYTSETKDTDIPKQTMTHLRVDSSVTEIPERTFVSCMALVHVQLPETLKRMKAFAFYWCLQLKRVEFISSEASLPESAKLLQIDEEAFSSCENLRKVVFRSVPTKIGKQVFRRCKRLVFVELPEGLQVIEEYLFLYCFELATVKMPSSVIKIGAGAFSYCQSLTSLDLPHGLLEIGETSFFACHSIQTLQIPPTVSSIGQRAFEACHGLQRIKLPPTLKRIEGKLCILCKGLEFIEIPATVKTIDGGAFSSCYSLSHVRIPASVSDIGRNAFKWCRRLISIELPKGFPSNLLDHSGCFSLVNVAGPILRTGERHDTEEFLEFSELGSVVDNEADLDRKLKHRFDSSPLNELCYYQSYRSSEDAMVQLRRLLKDDPLAATNQVDEFGMTPLHVLSLSQTPNLDMLLALMKAGHPDHILRCRDSFGSSPMDYLCLNRAPNSDQVIRRVVQTHLDTRLGLDRPFTSDMMEAVDGALAVDWSSRSREISRREIGRVYIKLAHYERMENFSSMELCLWKMKIDEVSSMEQTTDRESCRINNGASIVIPYVLTFLDKLPKEDYVVSVPLVDLS